MPLSSCERNFMLSWSANCIVTYSTGLGTFEITGTKLYVPVVTLSTKDHGKLLQLLKIEFKRTVNWNIKNIN